jgi:structural maintenance of chromosome 2
MKPPEILSMLEEAAGTRMYEMKKESALKTLEKKQNKVEEINKLLDDEILPALEKLRKERCQYMKWANGNTELDRLKRFCIAYEFVQAEKVRESALSGVNQIRAKIVELDESTEKLNGEIHEMDKNIATLAAEKEAKLGGEMKVLSEKVDKIQHALIKETSLMNNEEETLRSEEKAADKVIYFSYSCHSISNPHLFLSTYSVTYMLFAYRFSRALRTSRDL